MNHKYINKNTFDVVDNIFEVDELLAETISMLNKKGYYTKYCCSGHVKDPRIYELTKGNNTLIENVGYMVDNQNILIPYTFTTVYIMFNNYYHFDNLPEGFKQKENTIEFVISYYKDNVRKESNDIENEIKNANDRLFEWVINLPKKI